MNKIIVSIFLAIILVLGINKITDVIYYVEKSEKSAYQIESVTTVASSTSAETNSENSDSDIMALFASVDSAAGKKIFSKCSNCHNIANSKHKIGPSLQNIIMRKVGSAPEYKYSKALSTYGKTWDVAELNGFLLNPKKWIPKNKMGFLGLKKPEDRAAVILYMNSFSDNPLPLK